MRYRQFGKWYVSVSNQAFDHPIQTENGLEYRTIHNYPLEARTQRGERYYSNTSPVEISEAEKYLDSLTEDFDPTKSFDWVKGPSVYGSDAWGPEDEYKLACLDAKANNEPMPDPHRFL